MKFIDLTDKQYGKLKVLGVSHKNDRGVYYWKCLCECGNTHVVSRNALQQGTTKSCGCWAQECRVLNNTTHGKSKTPIYGIWNEMLNRTTNPNHQHYEYYMGRGIGVSESWKNFENFYEDMGDRPDGMWLERIDNNLGYSKENCKWGDLSRQASNQRSLNNTSGRIGVYWDKDKNLWRASIVVDGITRGGKRFVNFEDACKYIEDLELKYLGYSRKEGFV